MRKLFKNLRKKDYLLILICAVIIFSEVWLELKMPDYMSNITVLVQTEGSKMSEILKNGGYMLLCAFGSLVGAIITSYILTYVSTTFSKNIRKKVFQKQRVQQVDRVVGIYLKSVNNGNAKQNTFLANKFWRNKYFHYLCIR